MLHEIERVVGFISIHALREEGDPAFSMMDSVSFAIFLSTPSARRATDTGCVAPRTIQFLSTPSARRATWHKYSDTGCTSYFYPRPPRGGRPTTVQNATNVFVFLSTPSARRATEPGDPGRIRTLISIHALREEGDAVDARSVHPAGISIHALREEGDKRPTKRTTSNRRFLSTPSARRATQTS